MLTPEAIERWRVSLKKLETIASGLGVEGSHEGDQLCNLALRGLNAGDQWRGIESAPKDGTRIILAEGLYVSQGYWDTRRGWNCWCASDMRINPTHWQPLPSPPAVKEKP